MKKLLAVAATICMVSAQAQERIGPWTIVPVIEDDALMIYTENDSNSLFGLVCSSVDHCVWFMKNDVRCTHQSSYPALVGANRAPHNALLTCNVSGQHYRYTFNDFDSTKAAAASGGKLGIVTYMVDGNFNVNRFNIDRYEAAMEVYLQKLAKRRPRTKDSVL